MDQHATPVSDVSPTDDILTQLGRFSSWVAHEVNNPVAGIQNAFALLRPLIPPDHPHARFAGAIEREIARIAALTQRLHRVYSYDELRGLPVSCSVCVADAVRSLDSLCHARQVTLQLDIDPAAGAALSSGRPFMAAIRHMMQQAVETAPPGSVHVRARRDANRFLLTVLEHEGHNMPNSRTAAGPPGLAFVFVQRLVAHLGGELVMTPYRNGSREITIGLPVAPATTVDT